MRASVGALTALCSLLYLGPTMSWAGPSAPILRHRGVDTAAAGQVLVLRVETGSDVTSLAQVRLHYRWGSRGPYQIKRMTVDGRGAFVTCVPPAQGAATRLHYFFVAVDVRGRVLGGVGSRVRPRVVRTMLPPPGPAARRACPAGVSELVARRRPGATQLRRARDRARLLAAEDRADRRRRVGKGLTYAGLLTMAVGGGLVGYGLAEGPVFLWVGVAVAGVGGLLAVIGGPLWAAGVGALRRARHRLVRPQAGWPESRPGPVNVPPYKGAVFSWRFAF